MIFPVGDINPRRKTPFVNYVLLAVNVLVYFAYQIHKEQLPGGNVVYVTHVPDAYALVPASWNQNLLALLTSMFLHADPMHLFGNMIFLWIAGDNVEDRLGHVAYVLFYLAAGVAGAAGHIVYAVAAGGETATTPTIGASGAISGVLGAYLVFFPRSRIKFALWLIIFIRFFTLPSWGAIGFWVVTQILMARQQLDGLAQGETVRVAVFAHLVGFAFGFAAALLLRLFGSKPSPARDEKA